MESAPLRRLRSRLVRAYGLATNYYRDARGYTIETISPGGLVDKTVYDGAGRDIMDYTTDGAGGTGYYDPSATDNSPAGFVADDNVIEQVSTTYDSDSNPILVIDSERDNDYGDTGALCTTTVNHEDRASYTASWYNDADQLTATESVGDNGGSSWSRPDSPDSSDDTHLVTAYGYTADNVQDVTILGSPTGGSFTLTFNGHTTGSIAYNATASTVESALAALTGVGSGNVAVTSTFGPYVIRFMGSLAGKGQPAITATSSLTGGSSPTASVTLAIPGGDAGRLQTTIDPRGVVSLSDLNMLGQTLDTIAAFSTGVPSSSTDQTTAYTYNGDGEETSQTAVIDTGCTANQTTAYIYGVTTGGDSTIDSNNLLAKTEYPDATTGAACSASASDVSYTYDGLGEKLTMTDQNDTTHTYAYDTLGRETSDTITHLGGSVDDSVLRLGYSYTVLGLPYLSTAYSDTDGSTIVNQVEDQYNGLGQLTAEYQSHSGAVEPESTPEVQYVYAGPSSGENYSRLSEMVYPNGRGLTYGYTDSTLDDAISRVDYLSDTSGPNLVFYQYLGLGTVVLAYQSNNVVLSYTAGGSGDGGDEYTGLDRFGRIVDQNWTQVCTSTVTDDFQYAYDRDSNPLYRYNGVDSSMSELYHANSTSSGDDNTAYDPLGRLTSFERGTLSSSDNNGSVLDKISSPSASQSFTLDTFGNQSSVTTNGGGPTTNTSNARNELTNNGGLTTATFDDNGNTTKDLSGQQYVYNAWNQIVTVKNSSNTTIETFAYDALGRQIIQNPGTAADLYYSNLGQVLEQRQGDTVTSQYVWNIDNVNDLLLRDDNSTSGNLGITDSGLGERIFAEHDANFDVTAITDTSGNVLERFVYSPYGARTVLDSSFDSTTDAYNWQYGFQGMRYDATTGLYHTLFRDLNPASGTWLEADPAGYVDGANVYQAMLGAPIDKVDPYGLDAGSGPTTSGNTTSNETSGTSGSTGGETNGHNANAPPVYGPPAPVVSVTHPPPAQRGPAPITMGPPTPMGPFPPAVPPELLSASPPAVVLPITPEDSLPFPDYFNYPDTGGYPPISAVDRDVNNILYPDGIVPPTFQQQMLSDSNSKYWYNFALANGWFSPGSSVPGTGGASNDIFSQIAAALANAKDGAKVTIPTEGNPITIVPGLYNGKPAAVLSTPIDSDTMFNLSLSPPLPLVR